MAFLQCYQYFHIMSSIDVRVRRAVSNTKYMKRYLVNYYLLVNKIIQKKTKPRCHESKAYDRLHKK